MLTETAPNVAVILAVVATDTGRVEIEKLAVVDPAGTVTVAGVSATGLLDVRLTMEPPGPAGPFKVTVPIDGFPPTTDIGARVRPVNAAGGVIVKADVTDVDPSLAVMVAVVEVVTAVVVTVKVAVVAPAATVTLAGVTALVLLDDRATTDPPDGAAASSVTVPVDDEPPWTDVGNRETLANVDVGVIVSVAVTEVEPTVAVMVAAVDAVTVEVVIVKFADVAPAATMTLVGGFALVLLDARVTTNPPVGAGPLKVTVPVEDFPPSTVEGATATLSRVAGVTVRVAVAVCPAEEAVIVAFVLAATPFVVIVNVPVVAPPGIVTKAGATAAALPLLSATSAPPAGAARESVTVPVDVAPESTDVGLRAKLRTGTVLTWLPIAYRLLSFEPI